MILAGLLGLVAQELQAHEASPTRWSLEAGYSHRFFEASSSGGAEQRDYQNRARGGLALGGDVSAFPLAGRFGVGLTYAQFTRTLKDGDIGFPDGTRGTMRDVYALRYAGPAVFYRRGFSSFEVVAQGGAGWFYYHNQHEARDYPGVLEGMTLGLQGGMSLDYRPFRVLGVGVGARFVHGTLDGVDYNAIRTPLPSLSLTRMDMMVGVRFYP